MPCDAGVAGWDSGAVGSGGQPHACGKRSRKNVRKGFFEQEQFEAVLEKLADCLKPPITIAYITGWRLQTEVLPPRWDQVDLGAETVRLEVGTTKNKDGRLVYLTREMQAVLEAQWNEHITLYPDCDLVFHK